MRTIGFLFLTLLLLSCGAPPRESAETESTGDSLVYFGTYTRGDSGSQGVYVSHMDASTGELGAPILAAETPNPSFLAIHPNGRFVYAVSEISGSDGKPAGAVSAFEIIERESGKLRLLNTVSSRGNGPCHLNVDRTGKLLVVANYGSGSVAALPVNSDGSLKEATAFFQHEGSSVHPKRQKGPHAHSVNFSPDDRFVIAADLGLDQVLVYRADPAAGTLEANDPPFAKVTPGGGPRHFTFHPGGRFAYVINEMSNVITAFSYDAGGGVLSSIQEISTLPEDFDGTNHTAEVVAHPSGQFLYGSNRGHDSIAVFAIAPDTGKLTLVERTSTQGKKPRNFAIDPSGAFLLAANQNTGNIVAFRIDPATGGLTPTGQQLEISAPVCIRFVK